MRNEEHRLADCLPGLLGQDVDEIILLDDQSSDGTAGLSHSLARDVAHAHCVDGTTAPAGWVGKNWACSQLAAYATGDVLVFCDADISLRPGAVRSALAEMQAQHAEVFSVFPQQVTSTVGERLVVPLIDDVLLCFLPFPLLALPVPLAATANGSMLLFTRVAYDYLGGFAAVHDVIVEDVAIARRTRSEGLRLGLALGGDAVRTRMYDDYAGVVQGLSRGLIGVAGSRTRLILAVGWQLTVYTLPWVLLCRRAAWSVPVVLGLLQHVLVEVKTGRGLDRGLALQPLAPLALIPVLVQALRTNQTWKGRTY